MLRKTNHIGFKKCLTLKIKVTLPANFFIIIAIFIFLLFPSLNTEAQELIETFKRIETEHGLPPGNVNDIIQDSLGFIWLGTESGLARYDGYNFKIFRNENNDTTSLSHNHVFTLLKDKDNIIWVGTLGGGINRFDISTGKSIRFMHKKSNPLSISDNRVFKIYEDSYDRIWVSTLGGGLNLFDTKTGNFTHFKHDPNDSTSISSNKVSCIFEDSECRLWVGTYDSGLNLFDVKKKKFLHFKKNDNSKYSINHNQIMDIIEYSNKMLLIGTFGGGLNILNTENNFFYNSFNNSNFQFNIDQKNIRKIFNEKNNIWVGAYNGLYKIDKSSLKISNYYNDQSNLNTINSNKIRLIFQDKSKLIWVGTNYGVNLYDPNRKKINFHPYSEIKKNAFVVPLKKTHEEILWAGNINPKKNNNIGIKRKIKYYGNNYQGKEFKSNVSLSFYMDEKGVLWAGSYNGIQYLDKSDGLFKHIHYKIDNSTGLDNNFIKSFYFDNHGNFWAGTFGGGLTYYSKTSGEIKRYRHYEEEIESLRDSRVMPILEDSKGVLWIGTYGGLDIFDREKEIFKHYSYIPNDTNCITNERIHSIYESKVGDLWIGTYQGLNRYNREEDNFEQFTTKDGLEDNTIYGILEDDSNNLWIRTNKGISKFNLLTNDFKNYNFSIGLSGMEANGNIYFKDKSGKMFFGGLKGFYSFSPKNVVNNPFIPPIVFTELRIMDKVIKVSPDSPLNKPINEMEFIEFSAKDKIIDIEFASLHYAIPDKNKYAYKLSGYSDKWINVSSNSRTISLTNLNPGEYKLLVKASNSDGIWNDEGRLINIIINPPYWATWWFRIVVILVFLLLIFIIYEYRLHRLMEVERTRTRIAKNLHDEVGGTLASIQYFVNAIRKNIDEKSKDKFLKLILASSNDAQEKIKDIIWTVNPNEDGLSKFLVKFNRYASDIFDSKNISYVIDFPKEELDKKIRMEKRQHLWCICKETVINTAKHSKCENVKISFQLIGNALQYTIEDDRIGFDKKNKPIGNGFNNIAFRAHKLDVNFDFETSENNGVKLNISFRL